MKTIVLPGYSSKNKEWAEEAAKEVDGEAIEWKHWTDPTHKYNLENYAKDVASKVDGDTNIIAKSIGTLVATKLINKNTPKIIFCGMPINDLNEDELRNYKILSDIDPNKIIVFQNTDDEHGKFEEVREFLSQINPNIKIIEKPGSTHNYPYYDEMKEFLNG